jgi:hypothetical protein
MIGRILTFCGFLDFLAWRVTSEQLSEVTREDHDFSKSQELFRALPVHMSQIGDRLFQTSRPNLGMATCIANNTSRFFFFYFDFSKLDFYWTFSVVKDDPY